MKKVIFKATEFANWLTPKVSNSTTSQKYVSYLNSLISNYPSCFLAQIEDIFGYNKKLAIDVLEKYRQDLKATNSPFGAIPDPARRSDIATALGKYIDFLKSINATPKSNGSRIPTIIQKAHIYAYGKYDFTIVQMGSYFRNRMGSGDRKYANGIYFPVRIIDKIIGGKALWKKVCVDNIHVLTDNTGGYILLKDILTITISLNGDVECKDIYGLGHTVYTRTRIDPQTLQQDIREMKVRSLSEIDIDHTNALGVYLNKNKKSLPGIQGVNKIIAKHNIKGTPSEMAKQFQDLLDRNIITISPQLKRDLEDDLMRIATDIPYELMESRENSAKGTIANSI